LLPAIFMLITSVTMLVRLLVVKYLPDWPGSAALVVADVLILALTAGLLGLIGRRLLMKRAVTAN